MRKLSLYALAALAGAAALWLLVAAPRIELAHERLAIAQEKIKAAELLDENRLAVIEAQAGQLSSMLQAETKNRELLAQLASQSRAHTAALQELKRNDKAIIDYLDQHVPAGLGRLYQRAETTDPAVYRSPASLPVDPMRDARPPDDRHE